MATLKVTKTADEWIFEFALDTEDGASDRHRQSRKEKLGDLMVLNGPEAMHAADNQVEVLDQSGDVLATLHGPKGDVAQAIFALIETRLIGR